MQSFSEKIKDLQRLFKDYSLDDLARSLFVLSLWPGNNASPIKQQFLYVALESATGKLPKNNQINCYGDFVEFGKRAINLVPSFALLEDYLPENDWGEIRYYFEKKVYRVLYGGELSTQYDYYYALEIIHSGLDQSYLKLLGRSFKDEFKHCLAYQDYLIGGISRPSGIETENGHLEVPPKDFWEQANAFIDGFDPAGFFEEKELVQYSFDAETSASVPNTSEQSFTDGAYAGDNFRFFFIKNSNRYYPVLPRRIFPIFFEIWGALLKQSLVSVMAEKPEIELRVGVELIRFLRLRINEDHFFPAVSTMGERGPQQFVFDAAIHSKDKLFLIKVAPPVFESETAQKYLADLKPAIMEADANLRKSPTRLFSLKQSLVVEMRPRHGEAVLEPVFITLIPYPTTQVFGIPVPEDLKGHVISLEQFSGVIDEISDPEELSDFFDFKEGVEQATALGPFAGLLDIFGAFKDSSGILIPGARTPDRIVLDPHWGTNFRYKSLADFWGAYPNTKYLGHPRQWIIDKTRGTTLKSRTHFGYFSHIQVGNTSILINAPVHLMVFEQGKLSDMVIHALSDAFSLYADHLRRLAFAGMGLDFQIICVPASVVRDKEELVHLREMLPKEDVWNIDINRVEAKGYGIRLVFDDDKLRDLFYEAKDRSAQIELLADTLKKIDETLPDPHFSQVLSSIELDRGSPSRFRTFKVNKKVSFPQFAPTVVPEDGHFKAADKIVAGLAKGRGIEPGTYPLAEGRSRLNLLIAELLLKINEAVEQYNFELAIPVLLSKMDSLINDYEFKRIQIRASLDQEVDYVRENSASEDEKHFLHHHKNYRYLIEKFVQLRPTGEKYLNTPDLKVLLGLVDRILTLYSASDITAYDIHETEVVIDNDYVVSVRHVNADIPKMEEEYAKEQHQIDLGIIGNKDDLPESSSDIQTLLARIDGAFLADLDFGLQDLVCVLQVLSTWADVRGEEDEQYYSAGLEDIKSACVKGIKGFDGYRTEKILDFLCLKTEEILNVVGEDRPAPDLPTWEHNKRPMRYYIRPLIKIDDQYFWGPHSTHRSASVWAGVPTKGKAPADMGPGQIKAVLESEHKLIEDSMNVKVVEIVSRHTTFLRKDLFPHEILPGTSDIGDFDVLGYLPAKNTLLNFESKIIDPPHCLKDLRRTREKIFGRTKSDGTFEIGYLQKVEKRADCLSKNWESILRSLGWPVPKETPKIVSAFVTRSAYWVTKFPPADTEVEFVEIRLLDDLLRGL